MLNNKLTSSGGDSRTSKSHNIVEHINEGRLCQTVRFGQWELSACHQSRIGVRICSRPCTAAAAAVRRAHLSVHEQTDRPGDDGGLCWLSSANRLDYRDIGQFGGGGDLQAGGRWIRGAALPDGPGAGEEREGERCPAAESARNGREDAELREEDEETESAGGNARRSF